MFGRKKKLKQQAEAASLRAHLRLKIDAYKNEAALSNAKAKYFKEAARQDAELGLPLSDIENSVSTSFDREIEAHALFTAATALELIVARCVTKDEIISTIERLASEFAQDAARLVNKKAWRAHKQEEYGREALVADRASDRLYGLLAELFPGSG